MPSSRRGCRTYRGSLNLAVGRSRDRRSQPQRDRLFCTGMSMPLYFMVGASSYIGTKVLTGYLLAALSILVLYACGWRSV